ncbi:MAG: extracellular solute-binding protein [Chloroflexi bacterium]|nr:extracellular solute-binding protein [Chloroflexota bacterium]
MERRLQKAAMILLWLLLMGGCQATPGDDDALRGRVTLWHSWPPMEAAILEEALSEFQEIQKDVQVITVVLPEDELLEQFIEAGEDGFGPDLLLGDDSWIKELADAGLIRANGPNIYLASRLDTRGVALVDYNGEAYGIPLSLVPHALFYNKSLVTEPPQTLDELLQEAASGNSVAFVPRFEEAYWGIQTFGEGLFDEEGHFTLAESGLTEWLHWLDQAQGAPGVILNVDNDSLLNLFVTGQVTYYVADPNLQAPLLAMTEEEGAFEFGVVPLPGGPHGPAGPLLSAETMLLYSFSSLEQARVADTLASFLTNQQQSIRFMRELQHVPANDTVEVDQRIYPTVSGFTQQAETAVVLPNEIPKGLLIAEGNRAYASVLSGVLTPEEAVCNFGQEIARFQGYSVEEMSLPEGCEPPIVSTLSQRDSGFLMTHTSGGDDG